MEKDDDDEEEEEEENRYVSSSSQKGTFLDGSELNKYTLSSSSSSSSRQKTRFLDAVVFNARLPLRRTLNEMGSKSTIDGKNKKNKKKTNSVSDIDDIFGKVVKKQTTTKSGGDTGGKNNKKSKKTGNSAKEKEGYVKILLPGQKKPKGKRVNSKGEEVPEFTPVDKPRRIEDGLPVYKSYDDFTDMKHGQQKLDSKGRVVGPNGEPGGNCPFDCWCCF